RRAAVGRESAVGHVIEQNFCAVCLLQFPFDVGAAATVFPHGAESINSRILHKDDIGGIGRGASGAKLSSHLRPENIVDTPRGSAEAVVTLHDQSVLAGRQVQVSDDFTGDTVQAIARGAWNTRHLVVGGNVTVAGARSILVEV